MAGPMWWLKLVALILGLLVMVPKTMQINVDDPLYGLLQRLNAKEVPLLGIILPNSDRDEELFKNSGYFQPRQDNPSVMFAGRQFKIGEFRGMSAVYVRAGQPLANVGATTQLLIEKFPIMGIITYGTSESTSNELDVPNVVVPTHVADISASTWQVRPGKDTSNGSQKQTFWFHIDPEWLDVANEIEGSELERCIGGTMCTEQLPEIIRGLRIASSDTYVSNLAYANFLHDQLDVGAVDTTSAAIVSVAAANGVPHVVFQAASNKAGVPQDPKLSALASQNVLRVVAAFVDRLSQKLQPQPRITIY